MSLERDIARKLKAEHYKESIRGNGMYLFENNTKGDLYLPRATQSGRRLVRKGEQFVGDNYFFSMMKTNELKLMKELQSPEDQEKAKLLTEQPPIVTRGGQVEYVQEQHPQQKFNEQGNEMQDVLLTEAPIDGVKILR